MDNNANCLHLSSLVSSTLQFPVLPWEVIESVIDLCSGDKATLRAFALTCSQLHPRSLFILFTNVDIQSPNQLIHFYDAVQAQPHLRPIVQSLSFPWDGFSPFPLLSILPGLRHVTFDRNSLVKIDDTQLSHPTPLCGGQFATSLRSLTVRGAWFQTRTTFIRLLSAFPNIENLTCERLSIDAHAPLVSGNLSCRLQLQTLNILRCEDERVAELLFRIAQLEIVDPLAIPERFQSLSMSPPQSGENRQTSLTWWIRAVTSDLQHAIQVLRGTKQTAMRDVTLVLWHSKVWNLYNECRRPANLELCATLEEVLLRFPSHRVLLTVLGGSVLNVRKTICWPDEICRCFRPLSEKWALTADVRYTCKPGHDSRATALVVSSDGRWVATASRDSTIILWDARDTNISQEWFSHDPGVWYLAFSPDSRYLASVGVDGKVIIWDISRSSHQVTVLEGYTTPLRGCSWSESGAYIAALDNDGTIRLWDGRTLQPLPLDGANKRQEDMLLFSPDGHWLFAHNLDSSGIWDVASGTYLALQRGGPDHPCSAAFSRSSTRVAVGYYRGSIHVWDIAARREPLLLEAHESFVHDVVFSPDGRLLLSASWDKTMKISDARTGAVVRSLDGHKGRVHKACFSPCGRYIASASVDKTVRVWRTSDGSCLATLSDHGEAVWEVAFTPDGTMLWSAADNGTVWGRRVQDIVPDDFEL